MEFHYNAFISYRHAEVDSRIAEEVQTQLERYHLPAAVRKRTGIRRIDRIFRDKSELPLTSDLNDDILEALRDADFLILICSPRTKESLWVAKEVETFLGMKGHERILTVIAEGDPEDVVPQILKEKTVETVTEDGEKVRAVVPIEPLSTDYRIGIRQARRIELPRLVAAIVGCRYDELIQRRRQYLRRLYAAGAAAAMCAVSYLVWSNLQIRDALNASLISQSRYLAEESSTALKSGDRMLAVQLALKALPNAEQKRPVTEEAGYALTRGLDLYSAAESNAVQIMSRFEMEQPVTCHLIDETGRYLAMADRGDSFRIVDTAENRILQEYHFTSDIERLFPLDDSRVLVWTRDDGIAAFSLTTGEELWRREMTLLTTLYDVGILPAADRETSGHGGQGTRPVSGLDAQGTGPASGGQQILLLLRNQMLRMDSATGEILGAADCDALMTDPRTGEKDAYRPYSTLGRNGRMQVREDGNAVIFPYQDKASEKLGGFFVWERKTDTLRRVICHGPELEKVTGVFLLEDGRIIVTGFRDNDTDWQDFSNLIIQYSYTSIGTASYLPVREVAAGLSAEGELLWEHEVTAGGTTYPANYSSSLRKRRDPEGKERLILALPLTNVVELLDAEDGTCLQRYETESIPVEEADACGNSVNEVTYLQKNGVLARFQVFEHRNQSFYVFREEAESVCRSPQEKTGTGSDHYFVNLDGEIFLYKSAVTDQDWIMMADEEDYPLRPVTRRLLQTKKRYVTWTGKDVRAYDRAEGRFLWSAVLSSENSIWADCGFAGLSEDEETAYFYQTNAGGVPLTLLTVRMSDGETARTELPVSTTFPASKAETESGTTVSLAGGKLWYLTAIDSGGSVQHCVQVCLDPSDGSVTKRRVPDSTNRYIGGPRFNQAGTRALYLTSVDGEIRGAFYDAAEDTFTPLQTVSCVRPHSDLPYRAAAVWDEKRGNAAVLPEDGNEIVIYAPDGSIVRTIPWNYGPCAGLCFHDGLLYAAAKIRSEGVLFVYDGAEGDRIAAVTAEKLEANGVMEFTFKGDRLYFTAAKQSYVIDTKSWKLVSACMTNAYGYDPEYGRVLSARSSGDRESLGYFPFLSVEEMVQRGEAFTAGQEMSPKDLAKYGLE